MNIQWYPGHMAKTRKMIRENIALVDIVIELLDARIPISSQNPDIDRLVVGKNRIVVLNKADLADNAANRKWKAYFEKQGAVVVLTDSNSGTGVLAIADAARLLMAEKIERLKQRGRIFVPIRAIIVGIPNVGKSTLINRLVKKNVTQTADRPGVTRGKQWIKLYKDFELLDTPGILWPKFDNPEAGIYLAFTGAIKETITDQTTLAWRLVQFFMEKGIGNLLEKRYNIKIEDASCESVLEMIGKSRGYLLKEGKVNVERTAIHVIDEFREGKIGKITLESPAEPENP